MKVFQLWGEPTTNPKRDTFGVSFFLRGGDVCHPLGQGSWFEPPYFSRVLRFFCKYPILPFITWNLWGWRGYAGAKIYGADSEAYRNWMPVWDVYQGSKAIHFSIRLSIKD